MAAENVQENVQENVVTSTVNVDQTTSAQPLTFVPSVRAAADKKLGLLHYVSSARDGWHGEVRKRFTDFMVNEIRRDGQVLHLEDYSVGERPNDANLQNSGQHGKQQSSAPTPGGNDTSAQVSEEDVAALQKLVDVEASTALTSLYEKIVASGSTRLDIKANTVKLPPMDRSIRGQVHQEIRRIFSSKIETQTDTDGIICAIPANPRPGKNDRNRSRVNQLSFKKLGGDQLHFTLYKENKDTMDALHLIGRMLRIRPNQFGFAGTKDRRAATVQRVSVPRVRHETLDYFNTQIPAIKMGDYKYSQHPIQLGDHGGNEFKITVKNVKLARGEAGSLEHRVQLTKDAVGAAVSAIAKHGFINYYGHQRFGTHIIGTHELGKLMLMEKFEDVVNGLLHVDEDFMAQVISGSAQETQMNRDAANRARAIHMFRTTGNVDEALQILPKRFGAESNVMQRLKRNSKDFNGAIVTITRSIRNLYLHAYQSYVWNHAASYRWSKHGSKIIAGDLVLITSAESATNGSGGEDEYQRARPLSEEEVQSGKYTVFDVVLPGPGFDVMYPENDVGDFYVEFMRRPENGGLDPQSMRRASKEFSLSGTYRHFVGRFKTEPKWEVRTYLDDNEQMRPTDVDLIELRKRDAAAAPTETQTGASQPATGETISTDSTERRRQREDSEADPRDASEEGSSKRVKLAQDDSQSSASGAPVLFSKSQSAVKPVRQPTVPEAGAVGFTNFSQPLGEASEPVAATTAAPETTTSSNTKDEGMTEAPPVNGSSSNDNKSTGENNNNNSNNKPEKSQPLRIVNHPGMQAIPSFTQADLSAAKEEDVKIAVVLEFQLNASAYATVILRELMADVDE